MENAPRDNHQPVLPPAAKKQKPSGDDEGGKKEKVSECE